jgi:cytochrome c biogenesis protein CcmG, thiol:disulfide interchange protein DsbE
VTAEPKADRHRRRVRVPVLAALLAVGALIALLAYGLKQTSPNATIDSTLAHARAATPPGFDLAVLQRGALGSALGARLTPALHDNRIGLTELRGLPVVLNFWASWCVPCRTEAPLLERGWLKTRRGGVLYVGLNMQDLTGDARDFMRHFGIDYLTIRDPTDDVAHRWGVTGLPETFFLNRAGKVVDHVIGAISQDQLDRGESAALSGRPLAASEGGSRRPTR